MPFRSVVSNSQIIAIVGLFGWHCCCCLLLSIVVMLVRPVEPWKTIVARRSVPIRAARQPLPCRHGTVVASWGTGRGQDSVRSMSYGRQDLKRRICGHAWSEGPVRSSPCRCLVWRPPCHPFSSSSLSLSNRNTNEDNNEHVGNDEEEAVVLDAIRHSLQHDILPKLLARGAAHHRKTATDNLIVLLGVSGGCDSVALLHAMSQILLLDEHEERMLSVGPDDPAQVLPCQLHVVHFDHQQRGDDSDGDSRFVQELCNDLNVPCHVYQWRNNDSHNGNQTVSFSQDRARRWRQDTMQTLLASLVASSDKTNNYTHTAGLIVTAHHKDDSVETLLLKFLRGTHITHLTGMPVVRVHDDTSFPCMYARPMLGVTKEKVLSFLKSRNLPWRDDGSNASNRYLRNRVRNELVPLLNELMGGDEVLQKRLNHLSEQSMEVREDLESRAHHYLGKHSCKDGVYALPVTVELGVVEKEALYLWAQRQGCAISYDQIQRICLQLSEHPRRLQWTLNIGGGWSVVRNGMVLSLAGDDFQFNHQENTTLIDEVVEWRSECDGPDESPAEGLSIALSESRRLLPNTFIASHVGNRGHLTFVPPWRERPVKIREFLRGQKVPLHLRDHARLLCIHTPYGVTKNEQIVAVRVGNDWIVDSEFNEDNHETGARVLLKVS